MKWLKLLLIKIGALILAAFSLYFFLFSPLTLEIHNIHSLARNTIAEVVKESNDSALSGGLLFAKETGIEEQAIANLPSKMTFAYNYAELYRISKNYQAKGELTAQDMELTSNNKIQSVLNSYLLKVINRSLHQNENQVSTVIRGYQNVILAIVILYLLSALLILFGRFIAFLPLLVASLVSFGATWLLCGAANQSELATNLHLGFANGMWFGLGLALLTALMWPILLRKAKRKQMRHA